MPKWSAGMATGGAVATGDKLAGLAAGNVDTLWTIAQVQTFVLNSAVLVNGGSAASSTLTLQSTSGAGTTDAIIFQTGSQAEAMRIETGGRLLRGVTTTVPVLGDVAGTGSGIQQHGTGYANSSIAITRSVANVAGSFLFLGHSRNATPGSHTILVTGDTLGTVDFLGSDGVGFQESVSIVGQCEGTIGAGAMPGRLLIQTAPASSVTPTTRSKWDSKGNFIHGTAALVTTATDGFLYVPTCNGTPTGVATVYTGAAPFIWDTSGSKKLWFNDGGTWRFVVFT